MFLKGRGMWYAMLLSGIVARSHAATSQSAPQTTEPGRLTLLDLAGAEGVRESVLSPDGSTFALVRDGQIVLMPASGAWPRVLTSTVGSKSGLAWSPDGRSLAFLSEGAVWKVSAMGGDPVRLTEGRRGFGDPRTASDRDPQWSPNGRWLLFETGRRGHGDLGVVRADGTTQSLLTGDRGDQGSAAWSPDGTQIAFVERSPEHFSGRLLVGVFNNETGTLTTQPRALYVAAEDRGGGWSIRKPEWTRNGESLLAILQETGWDKIYRIPVKGGSPVQITTGESEDERPVVSPDGRSIAFVSNREHLETPAIWVVGLDGHGAHPLLKLSTGVNTAPQWAPDGRTLFFTHSSTFEPASLQSAAVSNGTPNYLLRSQPINFSNTGLPEPEVVHYKSKDGLPIAAVLYRPLHAETGKRHPGVLWIHGGPEGQDLLGGIRGLSIWHSEATSCSSQTTAEAVAMESTSAT